MGDSSSTPSTDKGMSSSFKQQAVLNSRGKDFWENFPDEHRHRTPPAPAFLPRGSSSGTSDDILLMDSPSLYGGGFVLPLGVDDSLLQSQSQPQSAPESTSPTRAATPLPTAADITRKVNNKRRRDDEFDPTSFKRRAVSPGMSVHNSPIMQSPMQRDINPWGTRPPSNSGSEKAGPSLEGNRINGTKRVGLQGMVDTNDGLMKMSIE